MKLIFGCNELRKHGGDFDTLEQLKVFCAAEMELTPDEVAALLLEGELRQVDPQDGKTYTIRLVDLRDPQWVKLHDPDSYEFCRQQAAMRRDETRLAILEDHCGCN
jgi:hypothetical protein